MREILFRGKRIDNGDFVFGMPWIFEDHACICPWDKGMCKYDTGYYPVPVIPETVGQYTGLTDKNGKKIFEGDILQLQGNVVEFCNGGFCVNGDVPLDAYKNAEIIGNIHDNPQK